MANQRSRRDLNRRDFLRAAGVTGGVLASGLVLGESLALAAQAGPPSALAPSPWDQVPAILSRITAPTFPTRTFDITAYGARGDGSADCTTAFRKAVTACSEAGGGRVLVPRGTFLTGAIHLLSNVELHVGTGATVRFSPDPKKYLPMVHTRWQGIECMNFSPFIYANGQTNVAITGPGTLDGQGASWRSWGSGGSDWSRLQDMAVDGVPVAQRRFGDGHRLRPNMIQLYGCTNILIADVTILRPPMWTVHPVLSTNVTVRNLNVNSRNGGGNNDGVDPECCTDVHITGCTFNTGDDCIAIKSGRDVDGRRVGVPSSNVVIEDCTFVFSNRGAICIGSEAAGGARNVFARNSRVNPANTTDALWYALFVKTSNRRGGVIDGVHLRNITVNKLAKSAIYVTMNYRGSGNSGPIANPTVQNITAESMTVRGAKTYAVELDGLSASHIKRVRIADSTFSGVGNPRNKISNADDVTFSHVTINGTPA